MTRISPRRKIALLLLLAFLAVPWAAWAGSPQSGGLSSPGLVRHVWGLLTSLWSEIGCHIDPSGCAATTTSPAADGHGDIGCNIDPSGCAQATATPPASVDQGDTGCHIDPSGGCVK